MESKSYVAQYVVDVEISNDDTRDIGTLVNDAVQNALIKLGLNPVSEVTSNDGWDGRQYYEEFCGWDYDSECPF